MGGSPDARVTHSAGELLRLAIVRRRVDVHGFHKAGATIAKGKDIKEVRCNPIAGGSLGIELDIEIGAIAQPSQADCLFQPYEGCLLKHKCCFYQELAEDHGCKPVGECQS